MKLLTPNEAAQFLGVSVHTLTKWRSLGKGPGYTKIGRQVRYRLDTMQAWLREKTVKTQTSTTR